MKLKYSLDNIKQLDLQLQTNSVIFLYWDLWAGKTTLSQYILRNILKIDASITSPTYTYYNKYNNHYHFDLYRINTYDEFFAIWWEDILDNHTGIVLIEWPEHIEKYYQADIEIHISKTQEENQREIDIIYNNKK